MLNRISVQVGLLVLLGLVAALLLPGYYSINEVTLYLTVVGLIYGLMAAFAIGVAWNRYMKITEGLHEELTSTFNMYLMMKHSSDKKTAKAIIRQLLDYAESARKISWNDYFGAEKVHAKFRKLFEIISKTKVRTSADEELFAASLDELRDASTARNVQLTLSHTPLSVALWGLLVLLSGSIVIGIFFVAFDNPVLGVLTKVVMSTAVFAMLIVLRQIDTLQLAAKELHEEPINQIIELEKRD
jgi:hypothetical protein